MKAFEGLGVFGMIIKVFAVILGLWAFLAGVGWMWGSRRQDETWWHYLREKPIGLLLVAIGVSFILSSLPIAPKWFPNSAELVATFFLAGISLAAFLGAWQLPGLVLEMRAKKSAPSDKKNEEEGGFLLDVYSDGAAGAVGGLLFDLLLSLLPAKVVARLISILFIVMGIYTASGIAYVYTHHSDGSSRVVTPLGISIEDYIDVIGYGILALLLVVGIAWWLTKQAVSAAAWLLGRDRDVQGDWGVLAFMIIALGTIILIVRFAYSDTWDEIFKMISGLCID